MRQTDDGLDHEHFCQLTDIDRIRFRVKTRPEFRPTFSIQLECDFTGEGTEYVPVVRLDDWHDRPHIDILHANGTKTKQWRHDHRNNKLNMKEAQEWLFHNWEAHRQRYEKELKQGRA